MRPMYIIGAAIAVLATVGVLAWTRFAPAQAPSGGALVAGEVKDIMVDEVEVRSGPSPNLYPTSKLRRGAKVQLVKTDKVTPTGWLAIKPPDGSQSWIDAKFITVQPNPSYGLVKTTYDLVGVRPASSIPGQEEQMGVESAKIETGTQVTILAKVKWDEKTNTGWWAILPPERDVRYIPESAVVRPNLVQPAAAQVQSGFVPPPGGPPLLSQADKTLDQAKELYQLAAKSNDPNESGPARVKLMTLQQIQAPLGQPGYPYNTAQSSGSAPRVTLGTQVSQTNSAGSTALYQTTALTTGTPQWTPWGTLKKTPMQKDGQPVFRLEDPRGAPLGYAVAAPGYTLETYVGQMCCLYGPLAYRSDDVLRGHVTVVSQIALQPAH
jgi:hypothetical protein